MATFTETQITDFLTELKRQSRDGKKLDGFNWRPLEAIAGKSAHEVFFILEDRELIRTEVLPGCFGHTVHYFAGA